MEHRAKIKLLDATRELKPLFEPVYRLYHARQHLPDYVFCDIWAGRQHIWDEMSKRVPPAEFARFMGSPQSQAKLLNVLNMWAMWRLSQSIYRFDPDVYQALIDMPLEGTIPREVFQHLPQWAVYVETPGMSVPHVRLGTVKLHGFWAYADCLEGVQALVLIQDIDEEDQVYKPTLTLLLSGGTIEECLAKTLMAAQNANVHHMGPDDEKRITGFMKTYLPTVLNLLIYLCTQGDMKRKGVLAMPERARPRKIKGGEKFFPAGQPEIWEIGTRIGAALRLAMHQEDAAETGAAHSAPRPHIRRAHWHTYRIGAKKQEDGTQIATEDREVTIRWLPPIPVNTPDFDALQATIQKVG